MMRGRKPKAIETRILAGNPSKRPLPDGEQPFSLEAVEKPPDLNSYESDEWNRLTEHLAPILCAASRGMLLVACSSYAEMRQADEVLQELGLTYSTDGESGKIVRMRPEVRIRSAARNAYHKALCELGASPVAHGRVKRLPDNNQQELPGILKLLG